MDIRKFLKDQRRLRKIKQAEIASALKVSPATISNYEMGHSEMPYSSVEKYIEYLGFEIKLMLK
jgi:transcriptional regulator with XRE-family HTH domain